MKRKNVKSHKETYSYIMKTILWFSIYFFFIILLKELYIRRQSFLQNSDFLSDLRQLVNVNELHLLPSPIEPDLVS